MQYFFSIFSSTVRRTRALPCGNLPGLAVCLLCLALTVPAMGATGEIQMEIGIGRGIPSLRLVAPQGGVLVNSRGKTFKTLKQGEVFTIAPAAEAKGTSKNRSRRARSPGRDSLIGQTVRLQPRGNIFEANGKPYHGSARIVVTAKGVDLIDILGVEDYLRGVVGAEIGSRSPMETLRAQAVIARTYAIANRRKHGKEGFDLCASEHCQAYGGIKAERPPIDEAVRYTRGIIMISDGVPISTLYHATCGGMTSDNEKVFGGAPTKYLRRVRCSYCQDGLKYRWDRSIPPAELLRLLRSDGHSCTRILRTRLESPAPLDRVDRLVFVTDRGEIPVKGTTIRRWLNLPSTTFVIGGESAASEPPAPPRDPVSHGSPPQGERQRAPSHGEHLGPTTPVAGLPGAAIGDPTTVLATLIEATPELLLIQSGSGLHRTNRPASGWVVLAAQGGPPPPVAAPVEPTKESWAPGAKKGAISGKPPLAPRQDRLKAATGADLDRQEKSKVVLNRDFEGGFLNLVGRGYGHQVGLCQSGSVELGKRNWSYRQILAFYYSQVALRRLDY